MYSHDGGGVHIYKGRSKMLFTNQKISLAVLILCRFLSLKWRFLFHIGNITCKPLYKLSLLLFIKQYTEETIGEFEEHFIYFVHTKHVEKPSSGLDIPFIESKIELGFLHCIGISCFWESSQRNLLTLEILDCSGFSCFSQKVFFFFLEWYSHRKFWRNFLKFWKIF